MEKEKIIATVEERQAIDFTKIYHFTITEPLRRGDFIVFDTEKKVLTKRKNVAVR